jgi:hypothetical protein
LTSVAGNAEEEHRAADARDARTEQKARRIESKCGKVERCEKRAASRCHTNVNC